MRITAAGIRAGDRRAAARLLTWIEHGDPAADRVLTQLEGRPEREQVIGITGAPGAGKSSLIDRLVTVFRTRRRRVGVLAVDPSSPLSGGAVLGDRIRMRSHLADRGVFIRSLSGRGSGGGLPIETVRKAVRVLAALGLDLILIETVGAGQDEIAIAAVAQTVVLVVTPAAGDEVQHLKSGLAELADLIVVNKADVAGADRLVRDLTESRERPVLAVSAATGRGVEPLAAQLLAARPARGRRSRIELEQMAQQLMLRTAMARLEPAELARLTARVAAGSLAPHRAAERLARRALAERRGKSPRGGRR